jgi:phosphotransferase system enzyme I (PtsI)
MDTVVYYGLPASPGRCVAQVEVFEQYVYPDPDVEITPDQIDQEVARLQQSIATSIRDLQRLKARIDAREKVKEASIFDAHIAMLQDTIFTSEMEVMIRQFRYSAETTVIRSLEQFIRIFEQMPDPYMRERVLDLKDIGYRLMKVLYDERPNRIAADADIVLIADQLLPSQLFDQWSNRIKGVIVTEGGMQSHTAILARALRIPMVSGISKTQFYDLQHAKIVHMDGASGLVEATREAYCLRR